ncbi:hydroxylamine reductase [Breznakia sp. PF5-3]|uniref:hydroxylamine reductase n=1 Tax=unclassified Breznakia TaxID=2623764 RepID=UPI00240554E8|nr:MULTISPECIES: hydroxylamine reductase [unclassified Breznakia]MDF9824551.1 hydroxylamine reductase [Breznakia sp. PM6-1]MDF9835337.1 hydroxylamine reductase [Breznakia sp. PF5-3]
MKTAMYCNQCEETAANKACTVSGVCGKDSELANLMDELKEYLKVLSLQIKDEKEGKLEEKHFIMNSMFKLITNANFSHESIQKQILLAKTYTKRDDVVAIYEEDEDLNALKSLIMGGLMGMSAYHSHAIHLGHEDNEIHNFLIETLAKINDIKELDELLKISDRCGYYGVKVMALLDHANTTKYGNPEITKVNIGVGKRPGILVSGHDLKDIEQLLEQSQGSGVDIYTHSEMLPAHYYPNLKKYDHLVGNYGNAWWKQTSEFESFHGPIIFTTNCIVPPKANASYVDKTYATGNCDYPTFKRIKELPDGTKDFSEVIAQAQNCQPPQEIENGEIVGGFAHNQVLSLADAVVENIKNGSIRKFVVMSGCDGRKRDRNYYAEFAKTLADDTIILTSGCAKYRYNKLQLKDINGIPRVLDAGQCNDSYSWVVVAMKLKEVFELNDINELPISFNIAWYEQKAIIVLLSLLHLGIKDIKVGPTLPGYLSKNTAAYLVEHYGISGINSVGEDIKTFG